MTNEDGTIKQRIKREGACYPLMLVGERRALIIGGGKVAERKVLGLLNGGVAVLVLAPTLTVRLMELHGMGRVAWREGSYPNGKTQCTDFDLVFAATGQREVNAAVAAEARAAGVLVNVADDAGASGFYTTATVHAGDLLIAISSEGRTPGAVKAFREWLEERLKEGKPAQEKVADDDLLATNGDE